MTLDGEAIEELRRFASANGAIHFAAWSHYWIDLRESGFIDVVQKGDDWNQWTGSINERGKAFLREEMLEI